MCVQFKVYLHICTITKCINGSKTKKKKTKKSSIILCILFAVIVLKKN